MLKVDITKHKTDGYIVMLEGHLDTDTYLSFEDKVKPLLVPSTRTLVINLKKLEYISSSGIGALFNTKKAIEETGGTVLLANLQPQIKRVFDVLKALPKESVFESMEEVDKYLDVIQERKSGEG